MSTFYTGQEVVTRSGKRGIVVEERNFDQVDVRFGSKVFTMRVSQLRSADSYDKAGRGCARQMYGQ